MSVWASKNVPHFRVNYRDDSRLCKWGDPYIYETQTDDYRLFPETYGSFYRGYYGPGSRCLSPNGHASCPRGCLCGRFLSSIPFGWYFQISVLIVLYGVKLFLYGEFFTFAFKGLKESSVLSITKVIEESHRVLFSI